MRNLIAVATLGLAFTVAAPRAARAERVTPPPVPDDIAVPSDVEAVLVGHAVGTQNYICLPSGAGFAYSLFTPEATLSADNGRQVTTHFFSPNPDENGIVRATWEHSRDTSTVWGFVFQSSTDERFVAKGAVPWLRVDISGHREGPTGGDALTDTRFVQRLNTVGGVAPETGCAQASDVGRKAFVPYSADYFFFETAHGHDERR